MNNWDPRAQQFAQQQAMQQQAYAQQQQFMRPAMPMMRPPMMMAPPPQISLNGGSFQPRPNIFPGGSFAPPMQMQPQMQPQMMHQQPQGYVQPQMQHPPMQQPPPQMPHNPQNAQSWGAPPPNPQSQPPPKNPTALPDYVSAPGGPGGGSAPNPNGPNANRLDESFKNEAYFKGTWSRGQAEQALNNSAPRTGVVRPSSIMGSYAVSYKRTDGKIEHCVCVIEYNKFVLTDTNNSKQYFDNMDGVLKYLNVIKYQSWN